MKGKISKSVEGEFNAVIKKGKKILTSEFWKNVISSKILKIKTSAKKISEMFKNFFRKSVIKYFSKVLII